MTPSVSCTRILFFKKCFSKTFLIHPNPQNIPIFPLIAVGLWSLHPMASESVIYITGRSESLCALFSFLSIGSWATGLANQASQSYWKKTLWYGTGIVCTLLACMTKEVGLMLPFVLLAMEAIFMKKVHWKHHIPLALVIALGVCT